MILSVYLVRSWKELSRPSSGDYSNLRFLTSACVCVGLKRVAGSNCLIDTGAVFEWLFVFYSKSRDTARFSFLQTVHLTYFLCNLCHATQTPVHPVPLRSLTHAIFRWCVDHSNRMNWAWGWDATAKMTECVSVSSQFCLIVECLETVSSMFLSVYYIMQSIFRTPDVLYLSITTW